MTEFKHGRLTRIYMNVPLMYFPILIVKFYSVMTSLLVWLDYKNIFRRVYLFYGIQVSATYLDLRKLDLAKE